MAFSSHQAPVLLLFLPLALFYTTFFGSHNLVTADETLINQQCHNSETPSLCIQCIKSDPKAQEADKVEIVTIVINCLSNHSTNIASNMTSLASKTEDEKLKSAYENCAKDCSTAKKELDQVLSRLKTGDYDMANSGVSSALTYQLSCLDVLENNKAKLPVDVAYEMRVYDALSEAALRIIDRF